jgi:16S rRNA C967 or C1407 C5-methylase (RsmB/RsmF family)
MRVICPGIIENEIQLKIPSNKRNEGLNGVVAGWWEALWPNPAGVLASVGMKPGMEVVDLCSGDGWFTLQIARIARSCIKKSELG